jgi:general secretion pathway protein E
VVIRILDSLQLFRHLYDLGLSSEELQRYMSLIARSSGLIIVTGPAGSGKTTMLYSTLKQLSERGISIVTIENPIKAMYEEFTQIAIHQSIGVTFDMAIQHILHLSPVALMVGVKQDRDVFQQTLRSALAGHLVFAEFQAHDAISALVELLNMDIQPFLIESAVNTIVAQCLLRKVCELCTRPYQLSESERAEFQIPEKEADMLSLQKGAGCMACRGTGYAGQTSIFEILEMTDELRTLIHQRAEPHLMHAAAVKGGMHPFRTSAIDKMKAGLTTPEEVLRVTGGLQEPIPHTFKSKITLSEN